MQKVSFGSNCKSRSAFVHTVWAASSAYILKKRSPAAPTRRASQELSQTSHPYRMENASLTARVAVRMLSVMLVLATRSVFNKTCSQAKKTRVSANLLQDPCCGCMFGRHCDCAGNEVSPQAAVHVVPDILEQARNQMRQQSPGNWCSRMFKNIL